MDTLLSSLHIEIRLMDDDDITRICRAEHDDSESNINYLKRQLESQKRRECSAFIAVCQEEAAGFVFLYYKCKWGGMANLGLPGVVDLKVLPKFRQKGIATRLMDAAEEIAKKHGDKVYLDVCLNSEYGPAQRLYIKRGYVPDGKGVYYGENVCEVNAGCKNDDELTLCLVKDL